jgi:hypothetical protein
MNKLLDEASGYHGSGNIGGDLRRCHNSHNATRSYKKVCSRGFPAARECVDREQKKVDIDACDSILKRPKL